MTSIFERALGPDFERLHPRMRERLSIGLDRGTACRAEGVMTRIWHGTPLLAPLLQLAALERVLVPESATDVAFTMQNHPFRDAAGNEGLTYERVFHLPKRRRRFDTATVYESGKLVDKLGRHRLLLADWLVTVNERGGITVKGGRQRVRVRDREVPIPGPLSADTTVHDWYDDDLGRFRIDVRIRNAVLGTLVGYQGSFTCRYVDIATSGS